MIREIVYGEPGKRDSRLLDVAIEGRAYVTDIAQQRASDRNSRRIAERMLGDCLDVLRACHVNLAKLTRARVVFDDVTAFARIGDDETPDMFEFFNVYFSNDGEILQSERRF